MTLPATVMDCLEFLRNWDGEQICNKMHNRDGCGDCAWGVVNIFLHNGDRKKAIKSWWKEHCNPPCTYDTWMQGKLFAFLKNDSMFDCPLCPVKKIQYDWKMNYRIGSLIWHLNDVHNLNFKTIADTIQQVLENASTA